MYVTDSSQRFSAAMAILNLVVRPFSILLLHRILQERSGSLGTHVYYTV